MKKSVGVILCISLLAGLLAGCGTKFESETNGLYVDKKGTITAIELESFEADYYDATELEAYVEDAVAAYTEENGKNTVKIEELTIDDKTAKLKMKYKTAEDYSQFNGIELYQGKIVTALAAGYDFDVDFVKVEDGVVTGTATKEDIYQDDELKVVVIQANTDVTVEGTICYVSTEHVKLAGTNSVSIRDAYSLANKSTESVVPEATENVLDTQMEEESVANTEATETGVTVGTETFFETDVYTYIIYK